MNSLSQLRYVVRWSASRNHKWFASVLRDFSTANEAIVIPPKVHRKPTDILQALASTVKRDHTAAHYKYHDDPYLIPVSNVGKRTFALAKESGRKAARWIQMQHADLFQHKVAEPLIEDFVPKAVYSEDSVVDEDTLKSVIYMAQVDDAITVYDLLKKQGKDISDVTKQSLLELLCFYNGEEPLPEELIEERWFWQSSKGREKQRKTWKDNGLAEQVFNSFKSKDSSAYSALIQGMARYFQMERAWKFYEETKEKNIPLTTGTYNALLQGVNFLRESTDLRWSLITELLGDMASRNMQPNIGTLNAVLESLSTMGNQKMCKTYALQTLSEFKALGIEPSLASYYFLLITFCKERGPQSNILVEIMNHIEGKEFEIQDPKDTFFFVTAMDICRNHLQDTALGYRVDELLHTGQNYNFIGDSFKESIYYRHFFMLVCATEPLEVFMALYNKLVPNVYIPEPSVMEDVIKTIDMNGAVEYIPRLWSDVVIFDQTDRQNIVIAVLSTMVKNPPPEGSSLLEQFENIAWDVWTRVESIEEEHYSQLRWTGMMLGDVLVLVLRDFDKACAVVTKLYKAQNTIVGVPHISALEKFLEACIQQKNVKMALMCIQYCADALFPETEQMAEQLAKALPLDADARVHLSNIVGKNMVKDSQNLEKDSQNLE